MAGSLYRHSPRFFRLLSPSYKSRAFSVGAPEAEDTTPRAAVTKARQDKIMSTAMKMYLQRKTDHDKFLEMERREFELGRHHLANMMGVEEANLTQHDIDKSIEYLFPSGLAPEARPVMKPPEEIFPKQKEAEFDVEGRPYHPFFYCLKPNLFMAMYQLREHMASITIFGDRLSSQGKKPDPEQVLNAAKLATTRWVTHEELNKQLLEDVSEGEFQEFVILLERLLELPFSYRVRDELFKYRVVSGETAGQQEFFVPQFDDQGRAFVECKAQRKTVEAHVKVTKPGTGKVAIRHESSPNFVQDITYFFSQKERHQLLFPLQISKMVGLVDIEATISSDPKTGKSGGPSGQAGALRYGISMCLRTFVDKQVVNDMKLLGLLTQDIRVKERKKFGKVKARKSYTWKRR